VLGQDFIRTARAKGLVERSVVVRHALKNAMVPIVTVIGVQAGYLLGGAVLTETVFAWPGVGTLMVQGILARDIPLVQGCVLLVALTFVLVNLTVDLLYAFLDPRIRYE
jgi:peptide/nickel transport system permease protein